MDYFLCRSIFSASKHSSAVTFVIHRSDACHRVDGQPEKGSDFFLLQS